MKIHDKDTKCILSKLENQTNYTFYYLIKKIIFIVYHLNRNGYQWKLFANDERYYTGSILSFQFRCFKHFCFILDV